MHSKFIVCFECGNPFINALAYQGGPRGHVTPGSEREKRRREKRRGEKKRTRMDENRGAGGTGNLILNV